jgi:hypothetical protein
MNRKIISIFVLMLLFVTIFTGLCIANISDQLDQQQTQDDDGYIHIGTGKSYAQSFVPSMSVLTRVELKMSRTTDPPTKALTVSIVRDNLNSRALTSVDKTSSAFQIFPGSWVEFNFDDISVNPGEDYFIVCSSNEPTLYYHWKIGYGNYPFGSRWYNSGGGWTKVEGSSDFCFKTYGIANQAPNTPSCSYVSFSDQLLVTATDPDDDRLRYGVSWDNDFTVDQWTGLVTSGTEQSINCGGRKGTVGVIAEDENGAQSSWVSVTPKNKSYINPFIIIFLRNHPNMFPLLRKIFEL